MEWTDCGLDVFLGDETGAVVAAAAVAAASRSGVRGRPNDGEPGENEGNDVSDLSDAAMEEAELDGWEVIFARDRDLARRVCPLVLLMEAVDSCDVERSRCAEGSGSISWHGPSASKLKTRAVIERSYLGCAVCVGSSKRKCVHA